MHLWDWRTGYNFQRVHAAVQPGSLDSESGIFACAFDQSESRLLTAEADKTIKVYKEDDSAVWKNITTLLTDLCRKLFKMLLGQILEAFFPRRGWLLITLQLSKDKATISHGTGISNLKAVFLD